MGAGLAKQIHQGQCGSAGLGGNPERLNILNSLDNEFIILRGKGGAPLLEPESHLAESSPGVGDHDHGMQD